MSTPIRLVPLVEPYLAAFAQGALEYALANGTRPERSARLAAICLRESHAGTAPGYRPKGPDGAGDWTARAGRWTRATGVNLHPDTDGARAALIAAGWALPKRKCKVLPGPYATPRDGRGWGRGLLQADVLGDVRDLIVPPPWPPHRQASAACAQLHRARRELEAFAAHPLFERAICARYNTTLEAVVAGLDAGDPDIGTTPSYGESAGDYGRDVLALEAAVIARWPDTGIDLPIPPAAGT